ncbi:MAG: hypothetical protein JWR32_869 [Mycobacterium sp.]|jgi:hypothetical protein|nr:hypothetical protein [Mycobacterium sp.]
MRLARPSAQVAAYYVVAEALTNAAVQPQASKVNVCVEGEDANIRDARTRLNCAQPTGRSGPNHGAATSAPKGDDNDSEDTRSARPCWPVPAGLSETGPYEGPDAAVGRRRA